MKPEIAIQPEDEIELRELFAAVLSRWFLIGVCAVLFTGLVGYYAFRLAVPIYTSTTVFEMPQSDDPGQLGSLSPVAGLLGGGLGADGPNITDLVTGRDFVLEVVNELDLRTDDYFNRTLRPPEGLALLLQRLGIVEPSEPTVAQQTEVIVRLFKENVKLSETEAGGIKVTVTHENPEAAAAVANATVRRVLDQSLANKIEEKRTTTDYLAGELATAQLELDDALTEVQAFAVGNNIASTEELIFQSQQLVRMRTRKEEAEGRLEALQALSDLLAGPNRTPEAVEALFQTAPQLLGRPMLLLLGEPQTPEDWLALPDATVAAATSEMRQALSQLQQNLASIEAEAEQTALQAAELIQLERNVKVKTATFEVIAKQFKEQDLLSGLKLSEGKIFETAVPALVPSSPRRLRLSAMGTVIGVMVGVGIAIFSYMSSGTLYSRKSLEAVLPRNAQLFSRRVLPRSVNRRPRVLLRQVRRASSPEQAALSFALNSNRQKIVIVPLEKQDGRGLAFLTAGQIMGADRKTAILDFSGQVAAKKRGSEAYSVTTLDTNLDLVQPSKADVFAPQAVAKDSFLKDIAAQLEGYDNQVFLLPAMPQGKYLLSAFKSLDPAIVTAVRLGRVRSETVQGLVGQIPASSRFGENLYVFH